MYVGVPIVTTRVGAVEEFERAAGERLFWSVPEDPTAHEISLEVRSAAGSDYQSERVQTATMFTRSRMSGQRMAVSWDELLEWFPTLRAFAI